MEMNENIVNRPSNSEEAMALENRHGAHNYHPLPVVLDRGEGVVVWDIEGKEYYDFLSAYSAVNQGHCHPAIVKAMVDQAKKLTLLHVRFTLLTSESTSSLSQNISDTTRFYL